MPKTSTWIDPRIVDEMMERSRMVAASLSVSHAAITRRASAGERAFLIPFPGARLGTATSFPAFSTSPSLTHLCRRLTVLRAWLAVLLEYDARISS